MHAQAAFYRVASGGSASNVSGAENVSALL